jgi:hypothetical protein
LFIQCLFAISMLKVPFHHLQPIYESTLQITSFHQSSSSSSSSIAAVFPNYPQSSFPISVVVALLIIKARQSQIPSTLWHYTHNRQPPSPIVSSPAGFHPSPTNSIPSLSQSEKLTRIGVWNLWRIVVSQAPPQRRRNQQDSRPSSTKHNAVEEGRVLMRGVAQVADWSLPEERGRHG